MKKGIWVLLAITLLFTALALGRGKDSVVVCSCAEQFRNDAMQELISEAFPNKNIIITYMPTGKAASKVYAEGENTEIDILVDLETAYLNKISDHLSDISGVSRIPYLPEFSVQKNNGRWAIWNKQAGAVVINKEVLEKHNLEAPRSYADLLKPEYKGLVAMPDPKSSGTGYFFFKSLVNSYGEEKALAYFDELAKNVKQFTEAGSGPIKLLKQGEIAIGLALTFQAVTEINNGQPLEIFFPETGSPYSLTGTAVIKGREKDKNVMEVFDYIANEFIKYDKEHFSPDTIYENQKNLIPNYPQNIPYADMSGIQDGDEKERLLSKWKY